MAEKPEDLNLPVTIINRLVKETLPSGVNVSKEARTAISKAASVFVLFATSCANNFALKAKRKTLTGQDVMSAMGDMDFESFVEPLQESLDAYRREQKGRKDAQEKRKKATDSTEPVESEDVDDEGLDEAAGPEDDNDADSDGDGSASGNDGSNKEDDGDAGDAETVDNAMDT